jgi:hypothetical protein
MWPFGRVKKRRMEAEAKQKWEETKAAMHRVDTFVRPPDKDFQVASLMDGMKYGEFVGMADELTELKTANPSATMEQLLHLWVGGKLNYRTLIAVKAPGLVQLRAVNE